MGHMGNFAGKWLETVSSQALNFISQDTVL